MSGDPPRTLGLEGTPGAVTAAFSFGDGRVVTGFKDNTVARVISRYPVGATDCGIGRVMITSAKFARN